MTKYRNSTVLKILFISYPDFWAPHHHADTYLITFQCCILSSHYFQCGSWLPVYTPPPFENGQVILLLLYTYQYLSSNTVKLVMKHCSQYFPRILPALYMSSSPVRCWSPDFGAHDSQTCRPFTVLNCVCVHMSSSWWSAYGWKYPVDSDANSCQVLERRPQTKLKVWDRVFSHNLSINSLWSYCYSVIRQWWRYPRFSTSKYCHPSKQDSSYSTVIWSSTQLLIGVIIF